VQIFVVGMPCSGNLGDDMISVLLADHIFKRWPKAKLGILCGEYQNQFAYPNSDAIQLFRSPRKRSYESFFVRSKRIFDYISSSDLVLIGGGGLFQDSHSFFTVHRWLHHVLGSKARTVPVSAVGVGFGPLNHKFSNWYLSKALARLSSIQVRDAASEKLVNALGYSAYVAPDIVSGSSLDGTPFARQTMELAQTARIGCSLRPWPGMSFTAVVNLVSSVCREKDASAALFVFEETEPSPQSELSFAEKIQEGLRKQKTNSSIYCYGKIPLEDFSAAFGGVTHAIASRFHANILWQKMGVPVLPLAYAPKVKSIYDEAGGATVALPDIDSISAPTFQTIDINDLYNLPPDHLLFEQTSGGIRELAAMSKITNVAAGVYEIFGSIALRMRRFAEPWT